MSFRNTALMGIALTALIAAPAAAQSQMAPTPGCKATAAELEANKKVAMAFFTTRGADRVALADTSYKQHNPVFVKRGKADGISDYEEFKKSFMAQGAAPPPAPPAGAAPPANNMAEIVTAECDIVTSIHHLHRQDPTEAPGTFYDVYTFDTFRIKNGKLVEHWDAATIQPPAPPAKN